MISRLAGMVLAAGFAVSANAVAEDFETPQIDTCNVWGTSPTGWTIESETAALSDLAVGICTSINTDGARSGTQGLVNFNSRVGTLVRDGGPFDLSSFWIHADDRTAGATVTVAGLDSDDNELFSTSVNATNEWTEVVVSWSGISKFTWDPTSPGITNISIDDLTIEPIAPERLATTPVPSTTTYGLILLILGMLLLAGFRFRGSVKIS